MPDPNLLNTPNGIYINGDLFGELFIEEVTAEFRDAYIIGFVRDLKSGGLRLSSHYINHPEQHLRDIQHYPQSLTTLLEHSQFDMGVRQFVQQLDADLIQQLTDLNMDHLAAYALIHNHPELRSLFNRPLILMAAYHRLYRFEKLNITDVTDYRQWFPQLFFRESFTAGFYRALAKIDLTDPSAAVSTVDYLIRNFSTLHRHIADITVIDPNGLKHALPLLYAHPALLTARWFSLDLIRSSQQATTISRLFTHTRDLLRQSGVANWQQTLLRQARTVDDVQRLHDRRVTIRPVAPQLNTPFPTFGLLDSDDCHIVCGSDELIAIAADFRNCARIFVEPALQSLLVHVLYSQGDDKGLLQIDVRNLQSPVITEFSAPDNNTVSKAAWQAIEKWILAGVTERSEIAQAPLLESLYKQRPQRTSVREPLGRYAFPDLSLAA